MGTGRVELFYKGQWGTICKKGWDSDDARVACRQLGYFDAMPVSYWFRVPRGTGQIWLKNVDCTGNEQSLAHCFHYDWGKTGCGHHWSDVGVKCLTVPGKTCYVDIISIVIILTNSGARQTEQ